MRKLKDDLKRRLEMDENMWMKVHSELGDMARIIRGLIARIEKLERKFKRR